MLVLPIFPLFEQQVKWRYDKLEQITYNIL
jgi:hypothetical protein